LTIEDFSPVEKRVYEKLRETKELDLSELSIRERGAVGRIVQRHLGYIRKNEYGKKILYLYKTPSHNLENES